MAIFGKLKKALGFSEEDIEEELSEDLPSAIVTPLRKQPRQPILNLDKIIKESDGEATAPNVAEAESRDIAEDVMPDQLFEAVVSFFNSSLPPYLRDSLDVDRQRRQIYESLSDSLKQYIDNLNTRAEADVERRWAEQHAEMHREIDIMRQRSKQIEAQSNELKELKLSAERQKRALSERVHDLEAQVAAFDAEREQYELENKSLVNKLRIVSVESGDSSKLADENNALKEQIRLLKTGAGDLESYEKIKQENAELQKSVGDLENDKRQFIDDVALLKKRCEIADTMINDLNHRATQAQKLLAQKEDELTSLRSEMDELSRSAVNNDVQDNNVANNDEIMLLKNTIADLEQKLSNTTSELRESKEAINMFEDTLTKFEEIKTAKNNTIADLRKQLEEVESNVGPDLSGELLATREKLAESEATIERLRAETESLKSTIDNNLRLQAESEAALRSEIESLKMGNNSGQRRRGRKAVSTPLDDSLDNTDWLISSPPPGENARPSSVSDAEFGYQETPRRKDQSSDNSAQMLLW